MLSKIKGYRALLSLDKGIILWNQEGNGMAYIKEICRTGEVIEIRKTKSYRYGKRIPRGKNVNKTPEDVKKVNGRYAEMKLRRLINTNFGHKDLFLTLTYRGKPPTKEEAKKHLARFLRILRKHCKAAGIELKYITVTEYQGKRIHHHVVMNKVDAAIIPDAWSHGRPDIKYLDNSGQYAELASYLIKETAKTFKTDRSAAGKRWNQSKNLRPYDELKRSTVKANDWQQDPKPLKGYEIEKEYTKNGVFEREGRIYPYQFYSMVRRRSRDEHNRKYVT